MHTMPSSPLKGSAVESTVGSESPLVVDRRKEQQSPPGVERRQFASSHHGLTPEARELAMAIDAYKIEHRRRYITFEEMLQVISQLGYRK